VAVDRGAFWCGPSRQRRLIRQNILQTLETGWRITCGFAQALRTPFFPRAFARNILVLPHSRCIWPHRRRWAFRCYMRADDFAAKFLKVTEGGTYLHRECGRANILSSSSCSTIVPAMDLRWLARSSRRDCARRWLLDMKQRQHGII
jgi:hypothetical protein